MEALTGHQKLAYAQTHFDQLECAGVNPRQIMAKAHREIEEERRLPGRREALLAEGVDADWYFALGNRYTRAIDGDWYRYVTSAARDNELSQQIASRLKRGDGADGRSVNLV